MTADKRYLSRKQKEIEKVRYMYKDQDVYEDECAELNGPRDIWGGQTWTAHGHMSDGTQVYIDYYFPREEIYDEDGNELIADMLDWDNAPVTIRLAEIPDWAETYLEDEKVKECRGEGH